jgi:DNA polymerase III subunit gamma/tau
LDADEVQLYYQIAVHGRNELGLAPDEYAGFSMTLLRMLAFRPVAGDAPVPPPVATPAPVAAAARLSIAPQAATATVVAAPPAASATPAAAAAPSVRPMSPARAAALEAARNGGSGGNGGNGGRNGSKPAAAPVSVSAPAVKIQTGNAVLASPPWQEDTPIATSAAVPQKKTEALLIAVPKAPHEPAPLASPPSEQAATASQNALVPVAVPGLDWDGNWPALAAALPLRGVAQQLAQQSELLDFKHENGSAHCHLRIPLDTLLSGSSADKLAAALSSYFSQPVRVTTETGAVRHTANAQAIAEREARQREAEQAIQDDPFVQTMMREFGATIVPGSIKPI